MILRTHTVIHDVKAVTGRVQFVRDEKRPARDELESTPHGFESTPDGVCGDPAGVSAVIVYRERDAELAIYAGEGHSPSAWAVANAVDAAGRMLQFIEQRFAAP